MKLGDISLWPLWIVSVLTLGIIFERALALRWSLVAPAGAFRLAEKLLSSGAATLDTAALEGLSRGSFLGRLFSLALEHRQKEPAVLLALIEEEGRAIRHALFSQLPWLATFAEASPLLGLLGTVAGLIRLFREMGQGVAPETLAQGVALALGATLFGLVVALAAGFAHRFFCERAKAMLLELEGQASKFVLLVEEKKECALAKEKRRA